MDACVSPRYTQFCHMPYWTTNVIFGSRPDSQMGALRDTQKTAAKETMILMEKPLGLRLNITIDCYYLRTNRLVLGDCVIYTLLRS